MFKIDSKKRYDVSISFSGNDYDIEYRNAEILEVEPMLIAVKDSNGRVGIYTGGGMNVRIIESKE